MLYIPSDFLSSKCKTKTKLYGLIDDDSCVVTILPNVFNTIKSINDRVLIQYIARLECSHSFVLSNDEYIYSLGDGVDLVFNLDIINHIRNIKTIQIVSFTFTDVHRCVTEVLLCKKCFIQRFGVKLYMLKSHVELTLAYANLNNVEKSNPLQDFCFNCSCKSVAPALEAQ